jgi:hypothetical protein
MLSFGLSDPTIPVATRWRSRFDREEITGARS